MSDTRECPVEGCTEQHDRKMLMCRTHWFEVPKPLRDELWRAYDHGRGLLDDRAADGSDYWSVRDRCIAAAEGETACRVCGCTDARACAGGCSWVEPDLCSACV